MRSSHPRNKVFLCCCDINEAIRINMLPKSKAASVQSVTKSVLFYNSSSLQSGTGFRSHIAEGYPGGVLVHLPGIFSKAYPSPPP